MVTIVYSGCILVIASEAELRMMSTLVLVEACKRRLFGGPESQARLVTLLRVLLRIEVGERRPLGGISFQGGPVTVLRVRRRC